MIAWIDDVRDTASATHQLVLTTQESPLRAKVDGEPRRRALGNLLGNAVEDSPRGGNVRLDAER